ncbi:unnamed protein product [Effrenium voratum]|uniref:Uncharacterized protein n=1 Tax=Effrenium voratum TaxID=2562239 RepID=A0AA36HT84_9DINO|nr:unnamed protein product [Effrenium voratum]
MQLILLDIEALASRAPPMVFDLVAGSLGRGRVTTGEVAPMSPWDDLQGAVIAGDAKAQGVADAVMGQSNTDAGRMEVLKQLMEQQSVGDWRFLRLETSSSSSEEPVESEPLAKKPKIEVRRMNRVEMQEELKAQGEPVEPGATVNQLRSQLVTARKSVETPMGAAEVQEPLPDKVETPVDAAQKQDKVETEGQEVLPDKVKTPVDAAGDQEPPHDMVETAHAAQKPEESRGVVWSLPTLPGSARFQQLAAHCPPARKKNKSLYVDQWLFEPINVHALEGAGSLRAFGQLGLRGRIADLLSRDTENSGMILTVYRDSGACHGCKARLVSGVHLEDYEELGKNKSKNKRQKVDPETETNEEELCGRFRELPQVVSTLTEMRVDSYDATRSAFSFGRLFKELCRTGLPVCDIDQTFSVGYSLLHRHADAQQVRYLLQNREACYAEVGVPDRDEVKKFFNGILMGGGSEHCERFMLRYKLEHLPPFVFILRQEMCKLAARDAQAYPELAQELSKDSGNWRSRLLELLHELREREVTDMMADTLKLYSEHKTVIHARNLFADYVSFRVQFGLVMCSNERLHMSLDGGTDRRLSVAEWPMQFCQVPRASHERLVQVGLKDEQRLADNSPDLLYVLLKVFKVFGAVQDTLVRPWPLWVEQATRSYLQGDSVEFVWESFVETWEMASRPSMECAGYGVVSDAWVAFARTKNVGVSAAGSHFKQAMLRHKHNGRYVAKFLNENQCFNQPKGSA